MLLQRQRKKQTTNTSSKATTTRWNVAQDKRRLVTRGWARALPDFQTFFPTFPPEVEKNWLQQNLHFTCIYILHVEDQMI